MLLTMFAIKNLSHGHDYEVEFQKNSGQYKFDEWGIIRVTTTD